MKFIIIFISSLLFSGDIVPQIVLDAIKSAECYKENGVCNPNFIRINRDKDVLTAKKNNIKMRGYIIKCDNPQTCSGYVGKLLDLGIKNMDLGPYQTNYYWQHGRWQDNNDYSAYFRHESSEGRAREILRSLIKEHGYSWRTLGRYHHFDPKNKKRNRTYYSGLYEYINGVHPRSYNKENKQWQK